jgi:catechol 2,3-dioxygenase-like lactoylglutathione lyase family enzyme
MKSTTYIEATTRYYETLLGWKEIRENGAQLDEPRGRRMR